MCFVFALLQVVLKLLCDCCCLHLPKRVELRPELQTKEKDDQESGRPGPRAVVATKRNDPGGINSLSFFFRITLHERLVLASRRVEHRHRQIEVASLFVLVDSSCCIGSRRATVEYDSQNECRTRNRRERDQFKIVRKQAEEPAADKSEGINGADAPESSQACSPNRRQPESDRNAIKEFF